MLYLLCLYLLLFVGSQCAAFSNPMGSIAKPFRLSAKEGDSVPNVVFKARVRDESIGGSNPFKWKDVKSSELFAGKRVVVFALPGGMLFASLWFLF